eukprot:TCONS_00005171-protein
MADIPSDAVIKKWKNKRWWMTLLTTIQSSLQFFEYSVFQITALFYFKKNFDLENPRLFYSISMGIIFASGLVSSVICGHYMDRTRDLRSIFIFTLTLNVLGNLMYTWTISPYFPVFGRFLTGFVCGVPTAATGEFSRVYRQDQLVGVLSRYTIISTAANTLGPCSAPLFHGVDIKLGWWHLTQYNFIGLVLAILALLTTIVGYFKLSNLTREPVYDRIKGEFTEGFMQNEPSSDDGKESKRREKETDHKDHENVTTRDTQREDGDQINKCTESKTKLISLKAILRDREVITLLIGELFLSYQSQTEMLTNMVAVFVFKWSMTHVSITLSATIVILAFVMFLVERWLRLDNPINVFYLYVLAFIATMTANSLLMFSISISEIGLFYQTILIGALLTFSAFPFYASTAYCRSLLFFITPSDSASTVESYRNVVQQFMLAVSMFLASHVFDHLTTATMTYFAIAYSIFLMLLCWYKKRYFQRLSKGRTKRDN